MAVNQWLQKTSNTEYIWSIYQIVWRTAEIVANKPAKYRPTFGDRVINESLAALDCAMAAQAYYVKGGLTDDEFRIRKRHLNDAITHLRALNTYMTIFLELYKKVDGMKYEDLMAESGEISIITNSAIAFINKIKTTDKRLFKEARERAEAAKSEYDDDEDDADEKSVRKRRKKSA